MSKRMTEIGIPDVQYPRSESALDRGVWEKVDRYERKSVVLVADLNEIFRAGVREISTGSSDIRVGGEAGSALHCLELLMLGEWDVLLLDLKLSDASGVDFLRKVRDLYPGIPILVFSENLTDGTLAIRAGAAGYLSKTAPAVEMLSALRTVASGGTYLSPQIAASVRDELFSGPADGKHGKLSPREREVMEMILSGLRPKEIANQLNVSIKTVSTHRTRLMKKIDVTDNLDLLRYALRHRLTSES